MLPQGKNLLHALRHEHTDRIPMENEIALYLGFGGEVGDEMELGPFGGGTDGFGVSWLAPESGGGQPMPDVRNTVLENICDWREIVRFPDVEGYHWKEDAEASLANWDPETQPLLYGDANGVFDRLEGLMGFEEALIALITEPEEVAAFFEALTDYKIARLHKVAEYMHPDIYCVYDDVATERSPFMSPEVYRELISPYHKRLADEIRKLGIIPMLHCCGHAECLIEDFIDEGFDCWSSCQCMNDIAHLCETYGDRIAFSGGYDSQGIPGGTDDAEVIRAEIIRCCETYGYSNAYIFFGFIMLPMSRCDNVWDVWAPSAMLNEEFARYAAENATRYRPEI